MLSEVTHQVPVRSSIRTSGHYGHVSDPTVCDGSDIADAS